MSDPLSDLLTALAACLCAQITVDGHGEPCFCGVIPGDAAVATYGSNCAGKNGMAWVRLATAYPAEGISNQSITPNNCASTIGFDIEVGILRQMNAPAEDGAPPTAAELAAMSSQQIGDMLTMRRAISCCEALANYSYVLGDYAPAGPLGLMYGGIWRVTSAL